MAVLTWDEEGKRFYETGTDHGVLYPGATGGGYGAGVAWNGLTKVTESPDGAEETALWADNQKYLSMLSAEEFKGTIEAYTYPDEFAPMDGSAELVKGAMVGQQTRKTFGLAYRTLVGNDTEGNDLGYKLHLVYGAKVSPSERAYETTNDSPAAITFSWAFTTTPVEMPNNLKRSAQIIIDSRTADADALKKLEDILYGSASGSEGPKLPTPAEVVAALTPAGA